ncbi:MAG: tetratricopeptide repeat protein [Candidatus Wallbacteria bacterium]|nr:tetratricopeptide repeat protein [Candidatus Wallbacteria bacterium]
MDNAKKNPLDRVLIQPPSKPGEELRLMFRASGRTPSATQGVRKELDARLTRYDEGSQQTILEIQDMLDKNPNNESLLDWLAFMMYTNEHFADSIHLYKRLLELNPDNATAHYYSANCYFKMGETEKAIQAWRRTMILNPQGKIGRKAAARIDMARNRITGDRSF